MMLRSDQHDHVVCVIAINFALNAGLLILTTYIIFYLIWLHLYVCFCCVTNKLFWFWVWFATTVCIVVKQWLDDSKNWCATTLYIVDKLCSYIVVKLWLDYSKNWFATTLYRYIVVKLWLDEPKNWFATTLCIVVKPWLDDSKNWFATTLYRYSVVKLWLDDSKNWFVTTL